MRRNSPNPRFAVTVSRAGFQEKTNRETATARRRAARGPRRRPARYTGSGVRLTVNR
jgi:hypothetical protein